MNTIPAPPHPLAYAENDTDHGRSCARCGLPVPGGFRHTHAVWCATNGVEWGRRADASALRDYRRAQDCLAGETIVADPERHPLTHALFVKLGALSHAERRQRLRAERLEALIRQALNAGDGGGGVDEVMLWLMDGLEEIGEQEQPCSPAR